MLTGRTPELDALAALLAASREGRGGGVLLVGEPGIGKTALLDELARRAADGTVLRADGVAREAGLPFAALQALVGPLTAHIGRLPAAQGEALEAALQLRPPTPHDRFAVPAALLGLLETVPPPVLLLVDDLPWLDAASRDTLLFAARRAAGRRLAVVAAARTEDAAAVEGLQRLQLGGLDDDAASLVLRRHAGGRLAPTVTARLLRAAGGNPLALRELPQLLDDDQRAGRRPLGIAPRPGEQVTAAFARRLADMRPDERRALTTAAALERGAEAWLLAALGEQGLDGRALARAEERGLLVFGRGGVSFRHTLLGAAAYHGAAVEERTAAHRALAATAPDDRRRAWHLAAAAGVAGSADPTAAEALAAVAHSARALGGHAEAAEAFARAAQLSRDRDVRDALRLEAAADLAVVGDAERALALVDATAGERDPAERRARIAGLRGHLRLRRGDPAAAHRVLEEEAVRQLDEGDPAAAAGLLLDSVVALSMTGDRRLMDRTVARLHDAGERAGGPLALLAELTVAQHRVAGGDEAAGRSHLDAALPGLTGLDPVTFAEPLALTAQCLLWLSDTERAAAIVAPLVDDLERASALGRLPYPLCVRAQVALVSGELARGHDDADAAVRLARETGQETMLSFILPVRARAAALLGDLDSAREDVAQALVLCDRGGAHSHAAYAHAVLGAVELAGGRPERAVAPLERAAALGDVAGLYHPALTASAGDLVEALAQTGRVEEALERIPSLRRAPGLWAAAIAARCALWSDADDGVVEAARSAVARLGAPLEVARTELAIGARAARARRFGAARVPLLTARDQFAALGARVWELRAGELVAAIGESGSVQTLADLTEEERRLAVLVSRGLTTDELAGVLHVGPKTVERRLGTVFRKLGVSSRPALARLVTAQRRAGVP